MKKLLKAFLAVVLLVVCFMGYSNNASSLPNKSNGTLSTPNTPTNLKCVVASWKAVTLSWEHASATGDTYVIQYKIAPSGPWILINTNNKYYQFTNLTACTKYIFQVRARDNKGHLSQWSIATSCLTKAYTPSKALLNYPANNAIINCTGPCWYTFSFTDESMVPSNYYYVLRIQDYVPGTTVPSKSFVKEWNLGIEQSKQVKFIIDGFPYVTGTAKKYWWYVTAVSYCNLADESTKSKTRSDIRVFTLK